MEYISDQGMFAQKYFCAKRVSKIIAPPIEIVLLFSIGTFLTNYDITDRKLYYTLIQSIVQKQTIWEQNNSMETTEHLLLEPEMQVQSQIDILLVYHWHSW